MQNLESPDMNLTDEELAAEMSEHGVIEVEEYKASDGWRWRVKDPGNHKNLAPAGQGFHDREECRENFRRLYRLMSASAVIRWTKVDA